MATSKKLKASPLCDVNVLTDKYVLLVKEVNPDNVLPSVEPFLTYTQIDEIKAENNNRGERVRKLLDVLQLQVAGKNYVTFNAFVKVLSGTQSDVFSSICGRLPTEAEADFCMHKSREQMQETIKGTGHTTDSELDEKIDLEYQHVQLALVNRQPSELNAAMSPHEYSAHLSKLQDAGRNISVNDILGSEAEPKKKILIFGRAGVGKTTTLLWMVRQWAVGRWTGQFTMIFVLQVRFLVNQMMALSTDELLSCHGLYQLASVSKHIVSWLEHSASRALILIDGLDEIPGFADRIRNTIIITDLNKKALPIDLCINILKKNLLPQCTVISASRPFSGLSELCVDVKAEILGLTSTQITEYIEHKHPSKAKHILSVLCRNPIILSVCSITYYCMLVSTLLSEGASFVDEEITTYTRLMAFILVQYASRKLSRPDFLLEVSSYLPKLAHLAYSGIFGSGGTDGLAKMVFYEEDLLKSKLSPNDLESAANCGILQVMTSRSERGQFITVEFFHLLVQELLAATYFLENVAASSDMSLFTGGQFNMCLTYIFGLHCDKQSLWVKKIKAAVNDSGTTHADIDSQLGAVLDRLGFNKSSDKLRVCQLVHEGQWVEKARQIAHHVVTEGKLCIEQTPMTAIDLLAVDFVCKCAGPLNSIRLYKVSADDTLVTVMLSSLYKNNCHTLQELNLRQNSIQQGGAEAAAEVLASNTSLTQLIMSYNDIGASGAAAIAKMLQVNTCLTTLDVRHNSIGAVGAQAIGAALSENTTLTTLDVSYNSIGDVGAQAIAASLSENTTLTTLDVSYNMYIGDVGAQTIAAALSGNTTLTTLNVSFSSIGDVGAQAIAAALSVNTALTTLDVSFNSIGEVGAQAIAATLSKNTALTTLNVFGNSIGYVGAQGIGDALHKNKTLTTLNVTSNSIGDVGAQAICDALDENKSLTTLYVSGNSIGEVGAQVIAAALHVNNSLTTLGVSHNIIGDVGAQAIAASLSENIRLTTLDVSYNSIGDVGAQAIAAALQENGMLTELYIGANGMGPDGEDALRAAGEGRPNLRVVV